MQASEKSPLHIICFTLLRLRQPSITTKSQAMKTCRFLRFAFLRERENCQGRRETRMGIPGRPLFF